MNIQLQSTNQIRSSQPAIYSQRNSETADQASRMQLVVAATEISMKVGNPWMSALGQKQT